MQRLNIRRNTLRAVIGVKRLVKGKFFRIIDRACEQAIIIHEAIFFHFDFGGFPSK
jgi:hypothetical protein